MPTGRPDAERARRIALAAIDVVAAAGVEGLTHRAVAVKAEVPLGSTTYYFATLEDLLEAAVAEAKGLAEARLAGWLDRLADYEDLAAGLAAYLVEQTGSQREATIVEYELYLAALRRPSLQRLSLEWDQSLTDVLAQLTDRLTATTLSATVNGLALQSLVRGSSLSLEEAEPQQRRALEADDKTG